MPISFCALDGKIRVAKRSYAYYDIPASVLQGNIGALIPEDAVVIDIDCKTKHSSHYIEWIRAKYPGIFITKSLKDGGYHIWFKTNRKIKRQISLMSVFGWKFDVLTGSKNYITLPDNQQGRRYISGFSSLEQLAKGWDGYKVMIPESIQQVMPFVDAEPAHKSPIEFTDGSRNENLIEWLGYFVAKGSTVETLATFAGVFARITGLDRHEIESTVLSSLAKYEDKGTVIRKENGVPTIQRIIGEDYYDVSVRLGQFVKDNDLFRYDEATGLCYCNIGNNKGKVMTMYDMKDKLVLFFGDKLFYINRDANGETKKLVKLPANDRASIFEEVKDMVSFNSRTKIYDDIPDWDGVERIGTFMKKYYECDANPNFFWLFMTALVGKLKEPGKCYVPYHFDFVGEKEVGKTYLLQRLSRGKLMFLTKGRSEDDMYVNIYNYDALVACDDECAVSKKMDYDLWKQIITANTDTFSRKFQQPEQHPRSFVMCRTCNRVNTAYAIDERRQIIFESKLPAYECRIKDSDVPDSFFDQMLAEAKTYYEAQGLYKLTDKDKEFVRRQQADSFDTENEFYAQVSEYIEWVRLKLQAGVYDKPNCWIKTDKVSSGFAISWGTYREWCNEKMFKPMPSHIFWNQVNAHAIKTGHIKQQSRLFLVIDGSVIKYAELVINEKLVKNVRPEIEVDTASAMRFFTEKKEVRVTDSSKELGALAVKKLPDYNSYTINPLIEFCPVNVQRYFESNKNNVSNMVPEKVQAYNLMITYGIGGIHYAVKNYTGTDLMYLDVRSMYPNIMINFDLLSRSATQKEVFTRWVRDREQAKREGNKELSESLKLKINSVYGCMKAEWCPLYDPHNASTVAVTGQILMTILIGGLIKEGCLIINANTDGLIIKPAGEWKRICASWCDKTGLNLSHKAIKKLEQADVNNYKAELETGEIWVKGAKYKG